MSDIDLDAVTPPLTESDDDFSDEGFFEDFLLRTYVPLSNLPTPPPKKVGDISKDQMSELQLSPGSDIELLGPAIHLCNLIPVSCSRLEPDVRLVHDMLGRAELPRVAIALGVSVLDCLDVQFARLWRRTLPLLSSAFPPPEIIHVDNVGPELVVLAALLVAAKFVDDEEFPTKYCAKRWGQGRWTCDQINVTEHCIYESLGYKIHPLWQEGTINDALRDMEKAGAYARTTLRISAVENQPLNKSPTTAQRPASTEEKDVTYEEMIDKLVGIEEATTELLSHLEIV